MSLEIKSNITQEEKNIEQTHYLPNVSTRVIKKGSVLWYAYFDDNIPYKKGTQIFWFCYKLSDVCMIIQYLMWTVMGNVSKNMFNNPRFKHIRVNECHVTQNIRIHHMEDHESAYPKLEKIVTVIDQKYNAEIEMTKTHPILVKNGDNRYLANWLGYNNYSGWTLGPLFGTQEVMLTQVNMKYIKNMRIWSGDSFMQYSFEVDDDFDIYE